MSLKHRLFGDVAALEAGYFCGRRVLIVRSGNGESRNIFVGDTRWQAPTEVDDEWNRLRTESVSRRIV
jgi:hypothetical protein